MRPLGIRYPFRVPGSTKYRPYWFSGPTLPLAVSSAAWSFFVELRRSQLSNRCALSSGFAFLQSVAQRDLVRQPQPANSSHGLLLPSAHAGSKVHLEQVRPPAPFRLQGLAALLPAYSLRALAGSFSHRQRSWDSPFGAFSSRKVSAAFPRGWTHVPFLPPVFPSRRREGPAQRAAASGLSPFRESLAAGRGFSSPAAGCSLGLYPPRVSRTRPCPSFYPGSSHTLRGSDPMGQTRRRPGVSIGPRLARPDRLANQPAAPDNPFRVSAPVNTRTFELPTARAMCSPRAASYIAADRPELLGRRAVLPELSGCSLRCRTSATSTSHRKYSLGF